MRALRLGVVLGDSLVEEKLVTGPVTLGQSLRCTLSVPAEGLPREHTLVTRDGGRFVLHPLPGMDGRIGRAGAIEVFSGERAIEHGARGKLRLGDVTILFQEVAALPAQPRPMLPASVRGTLADRIDRRLAVIIGGSLLVHVGIAAWAWSSDVDLGTLAEPQIAQTFHQDVIDVALPDRVIDTTPTQPGVAPPVAPSQVPHPIVPHRITQHDPVLPTHDDATRMAAILTSTDESGHGPGEMSKRQPGADLDKQLEEARTRRVTIGDDRHTSRVDDRANIGTTPDVPGLDPQHVDQVAVHHAENDFHDRIDLGPLRIEDPTSLQPDQVLQKIGTLYMAGLQHCYKLGLRGDAKLAGRVELTFTVAENGKVIDPAATGVTSAVDSCIQTLMSSWRFAIPRDKHGQPTDSTMHLVLALQPT